MIKAAALVILLFASPALANQDAEDAPADDSVPGSGFNCARKCGIKSDVQYEIVARLATYPLPGSANADPAFGGEDASMFTRSFVGKSGPFCSIDGTTPFDGRTAPIGPCLTVNPGQTMTIKVINHMDDGMTQLHQHKASIEEYWKLTQDPNAFLDNSAKGPFWFGESTETPGEMNITNKQDLPGWDSSFDDINLHLHGMQVVPHLFYPMGTRNPEAEWITIEPNAANPSASCFCYVFNIPEDHPKGTFFYHVHRHGSVAMQMWQGLFGLLEIGDITTPGSPSFELAQQGITKAVPFVTWEWAVDKDRKLPDSNTFYQGNFVSTANGSPIQVYPVNNEYQPTFNVATQETMWLKLLIAQTTTGTAFYIYDESKKQVPFWVFASDGISFDRAYEHDLLVLGVGQRQAVLVQFPKAGTYTVMQGLLNDFQGDGEGIGPDYPDGPDLPMAFIVVTDAPAAVQPVDLSALRFTPGMRPDEAITDAMVNRQITVNFQVLSQLTNLPVPQFNINNEPFAVKDISKRLRAGSSTEWTVASNMNYFHPIHIHVNPFQVLSMSTSFMPGTKLREAALNTNLVPLGQWRDTALILPFGQTVLRQHYEAELVGKTVFHCHFLDHEDQGMIKAIMIK